MIDVRARTGGELSPSDESAYPPRMAAGFVRPGGEPAPAPLSPPAPSSRAVTAALGIAVALLCLSWIAALVATLFHR